MILFFLLIFARNTLLNSMSQLYFSKDSNKEIHHGVFSFSKFTLSAICISVFFSVFCLFLLSDILLEHIGVDVMRGGIVVLRWHISSLHIHNLQMSCLPYNCIALAYIEFAYS